jgi:hypothetical protein
MALDCCLSDHLTAALGESVPDISSLISEEYLTRIKQIMQLLPGGLSDFWGFECRLAEPEPAADLLLCVKWDEVRPAILSSVNVLTALDRLSAPMVISDRMRCLVQQLHQHDGAGVSIDNIWLEFDCMASQSGGLTPCIFLGTYWERQACFPLLDDMYGGLLRIVKSLSHDYSDLQEKCIHTCLSALQSPATLFQTGVMLSRSGPLVRLCLRGIPLSEIPAYLRRVGWCGNEESLGKAIQRYGILADHADLDLDITDSIAGKIGIELWFNHELDAHRKRWKILMDGLCSDGLCLPAKAQALSSWPAFIDQRRSLCWPEDLVQRASVLGTEYFSAIVRWLHHVKIVIPETGQLSAKAYLGVRQFWPREFDLRRSFLFPDRKWTVASGCIDQKREAAKQGRLHV